MHSLTATLDVGEWSASRLGRFTPKERAPGTHWVGGWVGPSAGLDTVSKRKFPSPRRNSNPDRLLCESLKSGVVNGVYYMEGLSSSKLLS
jgi:hypothetical protein